MKIIKCRFTFSELCWILEALDGLLYDAHLRNSQKVNEIERVREHIIRLIKRMEGDNDHKRI